MKLSPPTKGLLLSLLGFAAFSISDAFSKLLTGRLNPFEVAFSGGVFGLLLVPFVKSRGQSWLNILPIQKPGMWWIRAVATFIATAASVESFMLLSMPEALSLMFLMPFIATILSVVALKEKVSFGDGLLWLSGLQAFWLCCAPACGHFILAMPVH